MKGIITSVEMDDRMDTLETRFMTFMESRGAFAMMVMSTAMFIAGFVFAQHVFPDYFLHWFTIWILPTGVLAVACILEIISDRWASDQAPCGYAIVTCSCIVLATGMLLGMFSGIGGRYG